MKRLRLAVICALALAPLASAARAEKSNQLRPTPAPIVATAMVPGTWAVEPRLVYTRYTDSLAVPGLAGQRQDYAINSYGVGMALRTTLENGWLSLEGGLEAYQKKGSITGPSPGDATKLTRADVTGNAFKLAFQVDARVFTNAKDSQAPTPGDFWIYVFARGIGDVFKQQQVEPLYRTDFSERSFEWRAGAAAMMHVVWRAHVAAFGGFDGIHFSGERTDAATGRAATKETFGGSERPFPFFGGDLMISISKTKDFYDTISLGAIIALTDEDESGYGGQQTTYNVSYAFTFGDAPEKK